MPRYTRVSLALLQDLVCGELGLALIITTRLVTTTPAKHLSQLPPAGASFELWGNLQACHLWHLTCNLFHFAPSATILDTCTFSHGTQRQPWLSVEPY